MARSFRVVFLTLACVCAAACPAICHAADRPNIIFILADDLGYGDLGCQGQKNIRTPNVDRLAAEGTRFTQFYAGSTVCAPSRCVLMTGLHTGHALVRGNAKVNLRDTDVTAAELLRDAGYATGLVGKWGLGHEGSSGLPTRQGFDYFFGYLDQHHAHNYYPTFLIRNESRVSLPNIVPGEGEFGEGVASKKVVYSPTLLRDEALDFIDNHHDETFFLYFSNTLPHANNEGDAMGMEIPDYGAYSDRDWPEQEKGHAAMVSLLDSAVGDVLKRLERHGIDERTVIFFSSDNGPHREGGHEPDFNDSNGPLRGIKRDLYEGGIRVPMIVRWPGKVAAGVTSHFIGNFADVLPTLAELAGASTPPDIDGISFVPTLLGAANAQRRHDYLYWEFYERPGGSQAVRFDQWKAVRSPMKTGKIELYDLSSDPSETTDVSRDHADLVARAAAMMEAAHTPSELWQPISLGSSTSRKKTKKKAG